MGDIADFHEILIATRVDETANEIEKNYIGLNFPKY